MWTSALLAQLALRLRADREGTELPLRMPGFPWLTCFGLLILAAIFTVGFIGEDSRPQLLSTFALVALLAGELLMASRLARQRAGFAVSGTLM